MLIQWLDAGGTEHDLYCDFVIVRGRKLICHGKVDGVNVVVATFDCKHVVYIGTK